MMRILSFLLLLLLAAPVRAADPPIFDAHLHYNAEAVAQFPLDDVLDRFRRAGIGGILANSRPNDGTWRLLEVQSPALWVVPFLRPYRTRADIQTWFRDPENLAFIEDELKRGIYRGIGEFHLGGADAGGAQVKRLVDLAVERGLWLHAHSDAEAIATLFAHNPRARVIWAHTGFGEAPARVEELLQAHAGLISELSYRGGITGADGVLTEAWRRLFTTYPDRFLLGSDTWINERWQSYGEIIAGYRAWLRQLPDDVAGKIAFGNAERLFGPR